MATRNNLLRKLANEEVRVPMTTNICGGTGSFYKELKIEVTPFPSVGLEKVEQQLRIGWSKTTQPAWGWTAAVSAYVMSKSPFP